MRLHQVPSGFPSGPGGSKLGPGPVFCVLFGLMILMASCTDDRKQSPGNSSDLAEDPYFDEGIRDDTLHIVNDPPGPCSLISIDEIAEITGVKVNNTLPQGNIRAIAACVYGGVDRPPLLQVSVTHGPGGRQGYESNKRFPHASVAGVGVEAVWLPDLRVLGILTANYYIAVTMSDATAGDNGTLQSWAMQIGLKVIEALKAHGG